ncbi:MAG: DEAD/DEAH box helicase [Myxococcaceae bacterium]|nr:DEAD/DEAH box helicase [Myxococcaceae bacterium]
MTAVPVPQLPLDFSAAAQVPVHEALRPFHPVVRAWFQQTLGEPTEPQVRGWPLIRAGKDVLIAAPTGSGKTLTAFLSCLDELFRLAAEGRLTDQTHVLYVSPLKALGNDVQKNLLEPLEQLKVRAKAAGVELPDIRVKVRSGDTPMSERAQMVKKPPHVLITTPESLYLSLTADRSRATLASVRTVVVDEIHALARDKRGSHFALSMERLRALIAHKSPGARLQCIGLSATTRPLDRLAHFLVGDRSEAGGIARTGAASDLQETPGPRPDQRDAAGPDAGNAVAEGLERPFEGAAEPTPPLPCELVQVGHVRPWELSLETPEEELSAVPTHEMWGQVYDRLVSLSQSHRTMLVFTNTRRLAERVAHDLGERMGHEFVRAHHGSMSRELRLSAEDLLKTGRLKVMVATASLELGIDVGAIDLVVQLGSPRNIAVMLQRLGRSGHHKSAISKGLLVAMTRDELVECVALLRSIKEGQLDAVRLPDCPLDVLAQQVVAEVAAQPWDERALFDTFRRAMPYRALSREDYEKVLHLVSEGVSTTRGRSRVHLHRDRVNGVLKPRKGARLMALQNGGAIPDLFTYPVIAEPDEKQVGTVDEDFAIDSSAGDVFVLGSTSWRIRRIFDGAVRVENAHGQAPNVPFWRGEAPGRTDELSFEVGRLRRDVLERDDAVRWLEDDLKVPAHAAQLLVHYLRVAKAALTELPTTTTLVAERFFDEAGGMQLIIHAPFGARINRAWGLALRKSFCRAFDFELQAAATDDAILLSLGEQHSFPLMDIFDFVHPKTAEKVLVQAVLQAPMFGTRFRWAAGRALTLSRLSNGKRVPPPIQRARAEDLIAAVFPEQVGCQDNHGGAELEPPDHPLVSETMKDCLRDFMDIDGLVRVLEGMKSGRIARVAVDLPEPSVLAHQMLNSAPWSFLDEAPLEERRARAVSVRRTLPSTDEAAFGALDAAAIAQVVDEARPALRDAEELHDALLQLGLVPMDVDDEVVPWTDECDAWLAELSAQRRAGVALVGARRFAFAAERVPVVKALFPEVALPLVALAGDGPVDREVAARQVVRGWMEVLGPTTVPEVMERLGLGRYDVEGSLARIEAQGQVLRGHFRWAPPGRLGAASATSAGTTRPGPHLAPLPHATPAASTRPLSASSRTSSAGERPLPGASHGGGSAAGAELEDLEMDAGPHPSPPRSDDVRTDGEQRQPSSSARLDDAEAGATPEAVAASVGASAALSPAAPVNDVAEVEWCDRRLLQRIHRLTVGRLRRDIEPLSQQDFMRFLFRWQQVGPHATARGPRGLATVISRLEGLELPAAAWERDVLPSRMKQYVPEWLDHACFAGDVAWGRLTLREPRLVGPRRGDVSGLAGNELVTATRKPGLTRAASLTFVQRQHLDWLLAAARPDEARLSDGPRPWPDDLSTPARDLLGVLERRGASFFAELVAGTRRLPNEVEDALWELLSRGFITADAVQNLRVLQSPKLKRLQRAQQRGGAGRWTLLAPLERPEPELVTEQLALLFLRRWGIVFRDLVVREPLCPPWRELVQVYRRLETRGELRGGRFLHGFAGEQFALPEAVDLSRQTRRQPLSGEVVTLSAADPLNLTGVVTPGPRVPATLGQVVRYVDGVPEPALALPTLT